MDKVLYIYNPHPNKEVTSVYIKVICTAFKEMGFDLVELDGLEKCGNKQSPLLVVDLKDVVIASNCGYKNILYWIQGVAPEEIYLKNKDILRYLLYTYREFRAIKSASFIFYCSQNMKNHYEKKYRYYTNDYYVMPCFNEEIHEDIIRNKRYTNNDFVYAGSLEKWQNFEGTVRYYKKIEERVNNTKFKVFVRDQANARQILDKYKIKNYVIDYVTPEQLSIEISQSKFGFCLREDITVNSVATPTKLSNYIANGMFPIYSRCLNSFYDASKNSQYCFCIDDEMTLDRIVKMCNESIQGEDVYTDYKKNFGDYYSSNFHISRIKSKIINFVKSKGEII